MKAITGALAALRSGEGLKGQMMRGGVGSIAVKIASTGLNLVLAVILARFLGAEGFGVYSFVFALVTILAIPAQMGLPNLVVRETAKAQVAGRWDVIRGLWRWSTIVSMAMSFALIILGGAAAFTLSDHLSLDQVHTFWWALALVPLVALGNLRGAALRGLRHVVLGQLPEFILRPALLILLISVAYVLSTPSVFAARDAMMLHVVASLAAFLIGAYLLHRTKPAELRDQKGVATDHGRWLSSAMPFAIVAGMNVVNQNIGTVFVGMLSTLEEAGYFRIAVQAGSLVSIGVLAVNGALAPYAARLFASNDMRSLRAISVGAARLSFGLAIAVSLVYLVFGSFLISGLFGSEFGGSYLPLLIITLGQIVSSLTAASSTILSMAGHERAVARFISLGMLLNVGLCVVCVPIWGAAGAAAAATSSMILWKIMVTRAVYRKMGFDGSAFGLPPKRVLEK